MKTNPINLVELVADEGKLLTDLERTGTFKKVVCSMGDISKYIEISEEDALGINDGVIESDEAVGGE